jgi:hypothetical protein
MERVGEKASIVVDANKHAAASRSKRYLLEYIIMVECNLTWRDNDDDDVVVVAAGDKI